jgi:hypothetical protein
VAYPASSDVVQTYPVEIHPAAYPVALYWHVVANDKVFTLTDGPYNRQSLTGDGRISVSGTGTAMLTLTVAGREMPPSAFTLGTNYPNPFNPSTRFTVSVPVESPVNISVYDVLGRSITTLVDDVLTPGYHTIEWNGRSENGQQVPGAVYFVRMTSGNFAAVQKIVMIK